MTKRKPIDLIITIILAVVGTIGLGVGIFYVVKSNAATSDGAITVKVVDLNDTLVKEKDIEFNTGDTLVELVENNFDNVVIDNGMVMSIETLTTPTDWSTYICIYRNNEVSNVGIKDIAIEDGDIISFVNTTWVF